VAECHATPRGVRPAVSRTARRAAGGCSSR
jgi:hypothetical protein